MVQSAFSSASHGPSSGASARFGRPSMQSMQTQLTSMSQSIIGSPSLPDTKSDRNVSLRHVLETYTGHIEAVHLGECLASAVGQEKLNDDLCFVVRLAHWNRGGLRVPRI